MSATFHKDWDRPPHCVSQRLWNSMLKCVITCGNNPHEFLSYNYFSKKVQWWKLFWCIYASVKHTNNASHNSLSPDQCQSFIWTNAGILLIGSLGTNFNEIVIKIHVFLFKRIHLKMLAGKWGQFCLSFNVLNANLQFWCHDMCPNEQAMPSSLCTISCSSLFVAFLYDDHSLSLPTIAR